MHQFGRSVLRLLNLQILVLFLLLNLLFNLFNFLFLVGKEVFEIDIGFFEDRNIFIEFSDQEVDDFLGLVDAREMLSSSFLAGCFF